MTLDSGRASGRPTFFIPAEDARGTGIAASLHNERAGGYVFQHAGGSGGGVPPTGSHGSSGGDDTHQRRLSSSAGRHGGSRRGLSGGSDGGGTGVTRVSAPLMDVTALTASHATKSAGRGTTVVGDGDSHAGDPPHRASLVPAPVVATPTSMHHRR